VIVGWISRVRGNVSASIVPRGMRL
jgi:hypothetical protein